MYTSPSGRSYIGQTWNENSRKRQHRTGSQSSRILASAIKKYGYENLKYCILHSGITNQMELDMLEDAEIENRKTIYPFGYNLQSGGSGRGKIFSDNTRKLLSDAQKNRPPASYETRMKISKALKGVKKSKEHAKKVGDKARGRKFNEDQIRTMKEAKKAMSVKIICLETMNVYESMTDASEKLNVKAGCISLCVAGKRPTAGGFHWIRYSKYTDELKNEILNKKTRNDIIRRSVICVETGVEYKSVTEALRKTGIKNISRSCKDEDYRSGGFHWRYTN